MATIENYLDFSLEEIPSERTFIINQIEYKIFIDYNNEHDFFTCVIRNINDEIIISNKLTFLIPINNSVVKNNLSLKIVPIDYNNPEIDFKINRENFSKIKLFLVENT